MLSNRSVLGSGRFVDVVEGLVVESGEGSVVVGSTLG